MRYFATTAAATALLVLAGTAQAATVSTDLSDDPIKAEAVLAPGDTENTDLVKFSFAGFNFSLTNTVYGADETVTRETGRVTWIQNDGFNVQIATDADGIAVLGAQPELNDLSYTWVNFDSAILFDTDAFAGQHPIDAKGESARLGFRLTAPAGTAAEVALLEAKIKAHEEAVKKKTAKQHTTTTTEEHKTTATATSGTEATAQMKEAEATMSTKEAITKDQASKTKREVGFAYIDFTYGSTGVTGFTVNSTGAISSVPGPAALPLMLAGLGGLGALGLRRRRKS